MAIKVNKRERENFNSLLYRFNKKMKRSGIFYEVKRRRFHKKPPNDTTKKKSALHKMKKEKEIKTMRRYAEGPFDRSI